MDLRCYIAMTAEEIYTAQVLPPYIAWMACHFSPYGTGITNLPQQLPKESMVILNDRIPPNGHDKQYIADQLNALQCSSYLLDFQRVGSSETEDLTSYLTEQLIGPVGISQPYMHCCNSPVLIDLPPHRKLIDTVAQLPNRELWLEVATDSALVTISESATKIEQNIAFLSEGSYFDDSKLHAKYRIQVNRDCAQFHFLRDTGHLKALMQEAQTLNIKTAVGLYQQLHTEIITDGNPHR